MGQYCGTALGRESPESGAPRQAHQVPDLGTEPLPFVEAKYEVQNLEAAGHIELIVHSSDPVLAKVNEKEEAASLVQGRESRRGSQQGQGGEQYPSGYVKRSSVAEPRGAPSKRASLLEDLRPERTGYPGPGRGQSPGRGRRRSKTPEPKAKVDVPVGAPADATAPARGDSNLSALSAISKVDVEEEAASVVPSRDPLRESQQGQGVQSPSGYGKRSSVVSSRGAASKRASLLEELRPERSSQDRSQSPGRGRSRSKSPGPKAEGEWPSDQGPKPEFGDKSELSGSTWEDFKRDHAEVAVLIEKCADAMGDSKLYEKESETVVKSFRSVMRTVAKEDLEGAPGRGQVILFMARLAVRRPIYSRQAAEIQELFCFRGLA